MNTSLQMLIMMFAGWVNEHQRIVIAYLQEENRVRRGLHGKKRLRSNNDQRRRLAVKGKALGRRVLREIETLVTPDTILRWHREVIARTYDGSEGRRPGRRGVAREIRDLVVRMEVAGIAPAPTGSWLSPVARDLVDEFDGFLKGKRHLIHDRDPLYTRDFRARLSGAGVESVRLPARSPNLNAYAERSVLSIKSECLDRILLLGERHLRTAAVEHVEHYPRERSHQGLGNRLIEEGRAGAGDLVPAIRGWVDS